MYKGHTIGVVVPAYNEEGFVGNVIDTVPDLVDRVYVVDDRSTDGTWEEIGRHAEVANRDRLRSGPNDRSIAADGGDEALTPPVVAIRHEENRGVGGAIKTGYLRALDDGIDVTAVMAGDGQMDPELLPRLLDPIVEGRADYAKGNRLVNEEYRRGMSPWRFTGNAILSLLTKIASGYWKTMDPQNGYTAISRDALERVEIEELYEYYGYCNDLLVKLNAEKLRVADVAIPAVYGDEESSIRYTDYIQKVSVLLLRNFLWRLKVRYLVRDFHPLALFYAAGAITSAVGLVGGLRSLYARIESNEASPARASTSLSLLAIGGLYVLFAMVLDMWANEDLEVQVYE